MRVVVTGSSGLLGAALVPALRADGHTVATLVRREPRGPDEFRWDPDRGRLETSVLDDTDAVVHLAGAGIGDHRWTAAYRQKILDSRVRGTSLISDAVAARQKAAPQSLALLSASAVGWYGPAADEPVEETDPAGGGFLADVVRAWEAATAPAADAGARVCLLRTGIVLSPKGGVLARQLPLFRLGVGGPLGSGRQWVSWIALDDWVAAARYLLAGDGTTLRGPVNLVAPGAVTGTAFARTLGAVLRRPAVLPVPRLALRVVLGDFADEGAVASQHVVPRALTDAGFRFAHPDLAGALRSLLAVS
jgi:uncharacterized protein (TIGR01777 family)